MIMFCLPGASCTRFNRNSWTALVQYMEKNNIEYDFVDFYSSDMYMCRNEILRQDDPIPWPDVVPFKGREYDFTFWIDSDQFYHPFQVLRLLEHDVDIVSGITPTGFSGKAPAGYFAFSEEGRPKLQYFHVAHIEDNELVDERGLIEVDFVGFGFICIKRGVFEKMGYPWFKSTYYDHGGQPMNCAEDVGWCVRARELGFKVYVDTKCKIGHEKTIPLSFEKGKYVYRTRA